MKFDFDGERNPLQIRTSHFSRLSRWLHRILWIWMLLMIRMRRQNPLQLQVLQELDRLWVQVFGFQIPLHVCVVLENSVVCISLSLFFSRSRSLLPCSTTVIRIPHHCRKCGYCVCSKCSPHRIVVVLNEPPQRVCDYCVNGAKDDSMKDVLELGSSKETSVKS